MRLDILSRHLPAIEGTAAGRVLHAAATGLLAEGADVTVTSWSPEPPGSPGDLPDWCRWTPLPPEPAWRRRGRAAIRPRSDVVRLGWAPTGLAVADDPLSAAALPAGGVATLHYVTELDLAGLRRRASPRDRQDLRAEARVRATTPVLAYSGRVADWAGGTAIPIPLVIPRQPMAQVEEPVAALVADWRWPPNLVALAALLDAWSSIRVPGARLLLAGRGDPRVGTLAGVEVLGPVAQSTDVLSRAAVLAFPCPDTSGPKVKVLEAAALGLAVITTSAGAEGLDTDALVVADGTSFAIALTRALADPAARAERAARARVQVRAVHAPAPAARARLAALVRLGALAGTDAAPHEEHPEQPGDGE